MAELRKLCSIQEWAQGMGSPGCRAPGQPARVVASLQLAQTKHAEGLGLTGKAVAQLCHFNLNFLGGLSS